MSDDDLAFEIDLDAAMEAKSGTKKQGMSDDAFFPLKKEHL